MKFILLISFFLVSELSFSASQGFRSGALRLFYYTTAHRFNTDSTNNKYGKLIPKISTEGPVRKGIFKIKGKPVDRQVYFEYLKCKHYRSQYIGSSVLIGIGAIALAGSIPLLINKSDIKEYYIGGGIVLANLGVFGLSFGIPFTISNLKFYKKKCGEQTMYISPRLNGFALAVNF